MPHGASGTQAQALAPELGTQVPVPGHVCAGAAVIFEKLISKKRADGETRVPKAGHPAVTDM